MKSKSYLIVALVLFICGLQVSSLAACPQDNQDSLPTDDVETPEKIVGITLAQPVATRWKVGVQVVGGSKLARNMLITIPVPNDWPEQRVEMVGEDIPPEIGGVKYRELDSGVKQLVFNMPLVRAGEQTIATMTFRVTTHQIEAPPDTSLFLRPKTNHREGKAYLKESPQIHFRNAKLRAQVKTLTAEKETIWQEVESIFDWVRDNIEQRSSDPVDSVDVFRKKSGCAENVVGLFVAMCRAHKIPARMVWVEGTYYAEFMLIDNQKQVHWFPCSVVGIREFGSYSDPRIILQKGDSIRVPEKKARQKFVAEFAVCSGNSKPRVHFIRELLPDNE